MDFIGRRINASFIRNVWPTFKNEEKKGFELCEENVCNDAYMK